MVSTSHVRHVLRAGSLFHPILRTVPSDCVLKSHILMIRSGMIHQLGSGVYTLLPTGQRVLEKLERLVDEELSSFGAQKISMPTLAPSTLWKKTGRWDTSGPELFKMKDRHGVDFCLSPTHEEVVTDLVASTITSSRQLPLLLYQTTRKFRDEMRPRAGVMRAREFVMKDMYSFDVTAEGALKTYERVREVYSRVLSRLGVSFLQVEADTGSVGGERSHEFQVICPDGDDEILHCNQCNYAANFEAAAGLLQDSDNRQDEELIMRGVYLNDSPALSAITIFRSRDTLNINKIKVALQDVGTNFNSTIHMKALDLEQLRVLLENSNNNGYLSLPLLVDSTVDSAKLQRLGYNNFFKEKGNFIDLCDISCPKCTKGTLEKLRGVEVGHAFFLGTHYSKPLNAMITDHGKVQPLQMGCFGIGITRLIAAILEQKNSTLSRIHWPPALAPYRVCIIVTHSGIKNDVSPELLNVRAEALYHELANNVHNLSACDIVLDDRTKKFGFGAKIKDAELIGYPWVIIVGQQSLDDGLFELHTCPNRDKCKNIESTTVNRKSLAELIKEMDEYIY